MTTPSSSAGHGAFHIEIQTPKQDAADLDKAIALFVDKYEKVQEAGQIACLTDNPMGMLSFQATDIIPELGLTVKPEQLLVHLNTFHTKSDLDTILRTAADLGVRSLLAVSGDGGGRLPKLTGEDLGIQVNTVTSVQLIEYIHGAYPELFEIGVAFNPYEPQDHELEKMRHKVDAGATFAITQPLIGPDQRVDALKEFGIPVIVEAWMSKKLHLLSECVGYTIPEDTPYDPIANLAELQSAYPDSGFYLALLGFKTQFPRLSELWV